MTIVGDNGQGRQLVTDFISLKHWNVAKLATGVEGVATLVSAADPLPTSTVAVQAAAFYPGFAPPPAAGTDVGDTFDEYGAKYVRGGVTTDEGSVRCNFSGAALARSIGTLTFTNGSSAVTGSGFLTLDPPPLVGDYIKLTADAESAYAQVRSIDSDTGMTLDGNYSGTGGAGATSLSAMKPITTGTGATITVASGAATIACGTTAAQTISLLREVDYGPLVYQSRFSISQRIANQTIYRGFLKPNRDLRYGAYFKFDGTTNTTVICETAWANAAPATGTDLQSTTVTLPDGATSATSMTVRIELRGEQASFYIGDINVANHTAVLPRPYDIMSIGTIVANGTTPATNTNVIIDYAVCNNLDSMRVSLANNTDNLIANQAPMKVFNYSVAGIITINTDLITIDCSQLRHFYIHCTSMGSTGVVTAQWGSDPAFAGVQTATLFDMAGASSTTFNAAVMRQVPSINRYLRLRLTTATTAGTTTIVVYGSQFPQSIAPATQPISGTVTASATVGPAAHDAAVSGNPLRVAGRALTTNYTTVATGDVADLVTTLVGALIQRPYSIPQLDFTGIDSITNTTTATQINPLTASNKNYVTGLSISTATLAAAGEIQLRSTPVASTTATIASNILVMAATYNWKVGDLVYITASTVTGLTAANYYYILTVSAANLTFSATRGGGTLAISGTTVSATLTKIIFRTQLQVLALPLTDIPMTSPVDGGTGLAVEMCTPVAIVTGRIDFAVRGYVAP